MASKRFRLMKMQGYPARSHARSQHHAALTAPTSAASRPCIRASARLTAAPPTSDAWPSRCSSTGRVSRRRARRPPGTRARNCRAPGGRRGRLRPAARRAAGPATGSRLPSRRGRSRSACVVNGRLRQAGAGAVRRACSARRNETPGGILPLRVCTVLPRGDPFMAVRTRDGHAHAVHVGLPEPALRLPPCVARHAQRHREGLVRLVHRVRA